MVLVKLSVGRRSRPFWVLELMCRRFCYYCFLVMALHSDIPLSITTVIPFFTVCGAFRPLTDTDTGYFEGDSRKVVYHSITHGSSKAVKHIYQSDMFHSELPARSPLDKARLCEAVCRTHSAVAVATFFVPLSPAAQSTMLTLCPYKAAPVNTYTKYQFLKKVSSQKLSFILPTTHTNLYLLHHVRTTRRYHRVD